MNYEDNIITQVARAILKNRYKRAGQLEYYNPNAILIDSEIEDVRVAIEEYKRILEN